MTFYPLLTLYNKSQWAHDFSQMLTSSS